MEVDDLKLYLLNMKESDDKDLEKAKNDFQEDPDDFLMASLSFVKGRVDVLDDILKYIENTK